MTGAHPALHEALAVGLATGLLERLLSVLQSHNKFPVTPHNLIIHFFLGFVASVLCTLAVPALVTLNFTAAVFLSIGTAQFHTVRNLERQMLIHLDKGEIIPRGGALIETVTALFEARNYLVLGSALLASAATIADGYATGIVVGLLTIAATEVLNRYRAVEDVAQVRTVPLSVQEDRLLVGDQVILTGKDSEYLQTLVRRGIGIVVVPNGFGPQLLLTHPAQRQAMLHLLATRLGVAWEHGHGYILPEVAIGPQNGTLYIYFAPARQDEDEAVQAVQRSPVLLGSPRSLLDR